MIYTVTGPVEKEQLGVTLTHEHLNCDSSDAEKLYFDRDYNEEKVEEIYQKLLPVFNRLYKMGCRTIAEASPPYDGQNLKLMQLLSEESGIKIIANTGKVFSPYVYKIHQDNYVNELARRWIEDFELGLDKLNNVTIRPGYIKLLFDKRFPEVNKRDLKAAMIASNETGMPIHCHILESELADETIKILEKEEFDFSKFLWAHASYGWVKEGYNGRFELLEKAAARGMWLGFDVIKPDNYKQHCNLLKKALDQGLQKRIILSQDYDFYEEVAQYGEDHQLAGLFTDFIPYCEEYGLSRDILMCVLTENPREFYNIE